MAICETCGLKYQPTAQAPECPKCSPARHAPAAATAGAPVARAAARPPQPRPAGATAGAAAAAAAPRAARPAAPPPPPETHVRHGHGHGHAHAQPHGVHFDKVTKIGFGLTGGLLVITLIVVLTVKSKHTKVRNAELAYAAQISDLKAKFDAFNVPGSEADCTALLRLAEETKSVWEGSEIASDVQRRKNQAQAGIDNTRERNTLEERFAGIERDLASGTLTPDRMREIRSELAEIEGRASIGGEEFAKKVTGVRKNSEHVFAERLKTDAEAAGKAAAENPDSARVQLRKVQQAEDAIWAPLNEAHRNKVKEEIEFFEPIYRELVELSDKLAIEVFGTTDTRQFQGVDKLTGDPKAVGWNPTNVKGFSWRIDGGVLQIVGPDAGTNEQALLAIGDREQWRNVLLDMEFTVEKGWFELYFRLGKGVNTNVPVFRITTEGDATPFEAGQSYHIKASLLGNKFNVRLLGEDEAELKGEELTWNRTRKGAIGLLVPPGARLKITKFAVTELL